MAINQFIFDGNASSPREVARKRALAAQIMGQMGNRQADTAMGGIGNALASLGQGFSARMWDNAAGREERAGQESGNEAYRKAISGWMTGRDSSPMPAMGGRSPMMPEAATETPEGQAINDRVAMAHSGPSPLPSSFLSAVDSTEGAGAYDTLYGHAQRDKFAGTDISRMPIRDVLAFSDPSGAYAQHVKGQIGRVATPMGRHQIVGTTLRNAVAEMGLDPNQRFDAQTQDAVAAHLARRRLASAGSMPEKISALRSEWHGFKSVPDNQMRQIVSDLENGGSMGAVNAMASGQPQAQADPAMAQQQPVEVAQASGGVPVQELMQALANPFLSQEQKSVLSMMLEQEMQNQDPMRQIEMERARLELEQLRNPQPQTTDDIREYEYARQQGYEGTYADFQQDMRKAGASSVNVSTGSEVGTIPQGFELFTDPETGGRSMRPIAGGPAAAEAEQAATASANRDQKQGRTAGIVTQEIDRALNIIDNSTLPTTGAIGGLLSNLGGTEAGDLAQLLTTVKANAGFDELQAMRDGSPTGGALGQVTETELRFLQATIGSLEQSQTKGQLKDNLNRVYNTYLDIVHGPEGGPKRRRLSFEAPQGDEMDFSTMSDEELEAIINGR